MPSTAGAERREQKQQWINRILGRAAELETLEQLVQAVSRGESRSAVIRGEAGIGKTTLLEYAGERARAAGCRVERITGIQAEMEIAFAGIQQLCASMLDGIPRLPGPQRDALAVALAMRAGPPPDLLLVGSAVLGLLAEAAQERALICLIDDAHWLDRASSKALAFAARRLAAESVGVVFTVRSPNKDEELTGLRELTVRGLRDSDARRLLQSAVPVSVDEAVRRRILAETRGNPLAILELPLMLSAAELTSGLVLSASGRLTSQIEAGFSCRVAQLPDDTQQLLLIAAAEPLGDPNLLWLASDQFGIGVDAAAPAIDEGLCEDNATLRFRHPLVRSAIYRAASTEERRAVHGALAEATDREADPDRYIWHLAQATSGHDEHVAAELETLAGRAQNRGGWAQAGAFLQRAAKMTPDPALRASRALAAARAESLAGEFDSALVLVATALAGPLDEIQRRHADLLRAQIAFAMNRGCDAAPLFLSAGARLESHDVMLARDTYLQALSAAMFAGRLATGVGIRQVAEVARAAPQPAGQSLRPADVLLDAIAVRFTDGYAAAIAPTCRAIQAFRMVTRPEPHAIWLFWMSAIAAADIFDDASWDTLSARHVQIARHDAALSELPLALNSRIYVHLFAGELEDAATLVDEVTAATETTGSSVTPFGHLGLVAWRGEPHASDTIKAALAESTSRGEGIGITVAHWANALLNNGLGRYQDAVVAAQLAAADRAELAVPAWALVELIEAASRSGDAETGTDALTELAAKTQASATEWALGLEARSRALLSEGKKAERLYQEAIDRLERTRVRVELGRAHLLYGEWLRRERRRVDARQQLRTAHRMLLEMGVFSFAERAARELRATGATARKRRVELRSDMTPQETQIARLASEGLTNPDIASRLFLSPRTVEYHLHKVFTKLQIGSRQELAMVLHR